jgi:ABC-2 type transport system ATP-binding protein
VHESSLADLVALATPAARVVTPNREGFETLATARGWAVARVDQGVVITGATTPEIGAAAFRAGLEIHGLAEEGGSLEDVFLRLTGGEPSSPTQGAGT